MGKKICFILTALILVPAIAFAGNSWLDKGSDLLKSFENSSSDTTAFTGLTTDEIVDGLKQALEKGALAVVEQLSAQDGFYSDADIHIPLPDHLATVKSLLDNAGLGAYTEEVELKLNRAAEAAAPKAEQLFLDALTQMEIADARAILDGPDDAATAYFKEKMSPGLLEAMKPVVDQTLESVGALSAYDRMMGQYKTLPFVPDVKGDLTAYGAQKAMDGIFHYLAKEEKAIRENPAKRTTELLQKVFN